MLLRFLCCFISFLALFLNVAAQSDYDKARSYLDQKNYSLAEPIYQKLIEQNSSNEEYYQDYLAVLKALKEYKEAEQLVVKQLKTKPQNPLLLLDLGHIYWENKKQKKAEEIYQQVLETINGDDVLTQKIANNFSLHQQTDWAIKCLEKSAQIINIPGVYNLALAKLYEQKGDFEKAISLVIQNNLNSPEFSGDESTEAMLLSLVGQDEEKQLKAQKAIVKLLQAAPENYYYSHLLSWIFSVQNKWEQAFVQVNALEKRAIEPGRFYMDLSQSALSKNAYSVALKACNALIQLGPQNPRYAMAREQQLVILFQQLENSTSADKHQTEALEKEFESYFNEYPQAYSKALLNEYARFEMEYAHHTQKAIALLEKALATVHSNQFFRGTTKLQLGDYLLIEGKMWEAALQYAQVDKAFREDALGEEARFKNAKLSFYQHDFDQAQGQLSVLKASTAELIANDALALSILITENTPADSNWKPLELFAQADLLMFQNKYSQADQVLDSITTRFPKNALEDDLLFLKNKIAQKQGQYEQAILFLQKILEQHAQDVLADDALYQMAELYRKKLNQPDKAKQYYEQLIMDYPGSSFVNSARQYLQNTNTLNP